MKLLILEEFETGKHFKEKIDKECGFKIGDIYWTYIKGSYIPNKVIKIIKPKEVKEVKKIPYFEMKVVKVKKEKSYGFCRHCGQIIPGKPIKPKGENWVNGENLDKIKFPCFCSYCNGYGLITRTKANEYYNTVFYTLHSIDKQHSSFSSVRSYTNFRDLIRVWDIHILKGKIIIYEEEA